MTPSQAEVSAAGVSARGQIAGTISTSQDRPIDKAVFVATRWSVRVLPSGGRAASASGISPTGAVVGMVSSPTGPQQPVRWTTSGRMSYLSKPSWANYFGPYPEAINSRGTIAGWAPEGETVARGLLWNRAGVVTRQVGSRTEFTTLSSISDTGVAVGTTRAATGVTGDAPQHRAVVLTSAGLRDLPRRTPGSSTTAVSISANGRYIVGTEDDVPAFLSRTRPPRRMNAPGFSPRGVSNRGVVVGEIPATGAWSAAAVYQGGRLYRLADVTTGLPRGWTLTWSSGINSAGDIVADATTASGLTRVVLLLPIR